MNAPVNAPMRNKTKRNKRKAYQRMSTAELEKAERMAKQTIAKYSADLTWIKEELRRREHHSHAARPAASTDD